jgi:ankyrin repeat protein
VLKQLFVQDPLGVNRTDEEGRTPVHFACIHTRLPTLQLLLAELGAFVDGAAPGWNGQSPLHVACAQNWTAGVELLVAYHADVNLRDNSGCTPLMTCVKLHTHACMMVLLRSTRRAMAAASATPDQRSRMRMRDTPLGRLRAGERLPYTVTDVPDKQGWTALHHAASVGSLEAIIVLHRHGANLNALNKDGQTPLHLAARESHEHVARCLLARQAVCNAVDRKGCLPADLLPHDASPALLEELRLAASQVPPLPTISE